MSNVEKIHELAEELYNLRNEKQTKENEIKDLNSQIKNIEEGSLSDLLDEEGISRVSLEDLDISKSLVYRGSYTKHTDKDAFKFLFDSHNEGALKQYLIVDLATHPQAEFVLMSEDIPYKIEYSIHNMTLSSILKELVESGQFTMNDIEKYSVYVQPQIKVKQRN